MAHVIEEAKSGRASCKTCKKKIAQGELRFGEEYASQFGSSGMSVRWHHLMCAASAVPDALKPALDEYEGDVPDKDKVLAAIAEGKKNTKPGAFPYVEQAPTGRASCMFCNESIEKGALRVAVEREVEAGGFVRKTPGYLHPACASEQLEQDGKDLDEFITAVKNNSRVSEAEVEQVLAEL